jgi:hypothetical protein
VAATVHAKPGTTQYLAFLRSAEAKSIFEGYGFSVLAKPTSWNQRVIEDFIDVRYWHKADIPTRSINVRFWG